MPEIAGAIVVGGPGRLLSDPNEEGATPADIDEPDAEVLVSDDPLWVGRVGGVRDGPVGDRRPVEYRQETARYAARERSVLDAGLGRAGTWKTSTRGHWFWSQSLRLVGIR